MYYRAKEDRMFQRRFKDVGSLLMSTKEILENIKHICEIEARTYDYITDSNKNRLNVLIYILSDIALSLRGSKDE